MFIGAINTFLFFVLPLLILFLARKKPIRQMVLWTVAVQAIALFTRIILYPIVLYLSWGFPLSKAASFAHFDSLYSGSNVLLLYCAVASIVFTALAILCAAIYRQKKEKK